MQIGRIAWRRDDPAFRQVFAAQFLPDESRELWNAFNELQRSTTSTDNVVRFLDTFANIDVAAPAARVQCPTLGAALPRRPPRAHRAGARIGRRRSRTAGCDCWTAAITS